MIFVVQDWQGTHVGHKKIFSHDFEPWLKTAPHGFEGFINITAAV